MRIGMFKTAMVATALVATQSSAIDLTLLEDEFQLPSELIQSEADTEAETAAKLEAQAEFFSKLAGFAKKAMKKAGPMLMNAAGPALQAYMTGGNPL